ncbi:MAG: hypothetical protein HY260_06670 [Chloroflexi bacterium]|nr:hypothetical protein [Chloroflexota bacterium]
MPLRIPTLITHATMGLDTVELVIALEEAYRVELPREDLVRVRTVADLFDVIATRTGRGLVGRYAGPEWEDYRQRVSDELGVEIAKLAPMARFLQDLGID